MSDARDEEWRKKLTPEQYHIAREGGTERAFTGAYHDNKAAGMYRCICCDAELFDSDAKFNSGTGWPIFSDVINQGNVKKIQDESHGMIRTEVQCSNCEAHLGHVFDDGPQPTQLRYCINSAALQFAPSK